MGACKYALPILLVLMPNSPTQSPPNSPCDAFNIELLNLPFLFYFFLNYILNAYWGLGVGVAQLNSSQDQTELKALKKNILGKASLLLYLVETGASILDISAESVPMTLVTQMSRTERSVGHS